jgi:eukaryotic-like serine/threonine-protein kinase
MSKTGMAATSDLERYRPVSRLGAGGMSTVELAEDTLLGRQVALKRMHTPDDLRGHSRLRREAVIGASLTHPNLVSIFDIVTSEDGDYVIVMEYVEGETLAQRLSGTGKPDLTTTLQILTGVSSALDAIHAERIVHRDVKPGNILLGVDGSVKLADLGIAAVADRTRITSDGAVLGTFSYMAPEQLEGTLATPAVDVYALAAVAWEMLSGRRARTETNPVALAHAISSQPPPDLRSAWPDAPAEAAEVLIRGMCRDPAGRPSSAGELIARLRAALEPETTARIDRPAPAAAPAAAAAAAPAAAAAMTPATNRLTPRRSPEVQPQAQPAAQPSRVPPPPARRQSRRGPILALAGLALAGLVAAIIIATTSGSSHRASQTTGSKTATHAGSGSGAHPSTSSASGSSNSSTSSASSAGSSTAAGSSGTGTGASAGSPVSAVETFYHLAAAHQYSSAWALADPSFRNQLGGYSSFQSGQAGDRSITFTGAQVTNQSANSATVYVHTTSVRYNGTQHCYGPVNLIHGSSGWLVDHISINCV